MNDNVNHPSHYTDGKIEVIDFIEDKNLNYHLGNVVKYVSRAGKKDPEKYLEDLQKAEWYLKREIDTKTPQTEKSLSMEDIERFGRFFDKLLTDTRYEPVVVQSTYSEETLKAMLKDNREIPDGAIFGIDLKDGTYIELMCGYDDSGTRFLVFRDIYWTSEFDSDGSSFWKDCTYRDKANSEWFENLPGWLQEYVKPRMNVDVFDDQRVEAEDRMFALSLPQIYSKAELAADWNEEIAARIKARNPEDSQISLFKDPRNRIKLYTHPETDFTYAYYWWTRSAYSYSPPTCYSFIGSNGSSSNSYTSAAYGVVLGFCV